MSKLKTILWAIRHPVFAFHWLRHKQPFPYLAALLVLSLIGCANLSTTAFRAEKVVGDTARGSVHAWNQYFPIATNGASVVECNKLMAEQAQIYDASRKLGATLQVVENLRLAYVTNSAQTNLTALQAALDALNSQSAGIASLVQTFMAGTPVGAINN